MKEIKRLVVLSLCIALLGAFALGSGESSGAQKVGEVEKESSDAASTSQKEESKSSNDEQKSASQDELKDVYHVGETMSYKGLDIAYVESSYYTSDNQFITPKDGNQFIRLLMHVDNNTGSDKSVNTFDFHCYADGYECESTYFDDDLSASLSDGRSTDGAIYFEVPLNAKDIEVEYEYDFFNNGKVKFVFEGDKSSGLTFETNSAQSDEVFHVGDIIETNAVRITYTKAAEYVSNNEFLMPKDGYRYIYIELDVENISNSDQLVSYFSFNCYADGQSCDGYYGMDDALSATLSPGRKGKGTIAFEVPKDAQTIEIEYEDNVWTQNKLIFLYED